MNQLNRYGMHIFLWVTVSVILLPIILLLLWCFANRWPWPEIIPSVWTLRGVKRLFFGYNNIWNVLYSSILLSLMVAVISAVISTMAARAFAYYSFPGKSLIEFIVLLPVIVPATVFGMGVHILSIEFHLNNTRAAVIISHLICTLPYGVKIMTETTKASSLRFEEQAKVLGASVLHSFIHGSLPIIAPGIISAMAVSFLMSYTQYFLTLLLGGGKVKTLAILVMPLIEGSDRTISSVFCMLFILSSMIIFIFFQFLSNVIAKRCGTNLGL